MSEKPYKVIITPFAEASLQQYDDYLRFELYADQAADDWIDLFENSVKELAFFPAKYPLVSNEPWHSEGVHSFPVKGQMIYYWISDERMKVYVMDVVSQRMDQNKRLIESQITFYQEMLKGLE